MKSISITDMETGQRIALDESNLPIINTAITALKKYPNRPEVFIPKLKPPSWLSPYTNALKPNKSIYAIRRW